MDIFYYFENDLYWDFRTIRDRVSIPESTLYRLIKRKCSGKKFRNKLLYRYKDLLELPEIYKEIQNHEVL
jgi:hypothetical protein